MSLKAKQEQARELTRQLERSMLIEKIWPEAFTGGGKVGLKGKLAWDKEKKRQALIEAYFLNSKTGAKKTLNPQELAQWNPDLIAHTQFKS